jgi:DNA gyrase subunit A
LLNYWLEFRYGTVRRRFEHDLRGLEARIHILEAFAVAFDALDEILQIIRASEGKKDAARKLMDRFLFDEIQTDAILDLQLYKLARLEIRVIMDELDARREAAADIRTILGSETKMWGRVRKELIELRDVYATPRRTAVGAPTAELTFDEGAYVEREETFVVVTRDGWLKRQSSFTEVGRIRVREHDEVGWLVKADTTTTITLFASDGTAYTAKIADLPATSGYGMPLSKLFTVADGATVVGVVVHEPTAFVGMPVDPAPAPEDPAPPFVVGVTRQGRIQRLALEPYVEESTRAGRKYARVDKEDAVLAAFVAMGGESVCLGTKGGNLLVFPLKEAPALRGAGKGTTAITLRDEDEVFAAGLAVAPTEGIRITNSAGQTWLVGPGMSDARGSRAAAGKRAFRKGSMTTWHRDPVVRVPEQATTRAAAASIEPEEGEE